MTQRGNRQADAMKTKMQYVSDGEIPLAEQPSQDFDPQLLLEALHDLDVMKLGFERMAKTPHQKSKDGEVPRKSQEDAINKEEPKEPADIFGENSNSLLVDINTGYIMVSEEYYP